MPNITRGEKLTGLLVYLAGPGRANEHTEPHLVAGDVAVMAWHDDAELDHDTAVAIARHVDQPRRVFGVEVPGGSVWHCSLSLRAEEGQLPDETWAAIAHDFVDAMGFSEASGRAACRWVAVRHGLSARGNDHIHLAVSLVREDGTKANVWMDQPRAQRVAGELELAYGLEVLESRQAGRGGRGYQPAEQATAARAGAPEVARASLARTVRGCAAAAGDEAEFVRRLRRAGVLARPRYAAGRDDVVLGYSVALRPGRHGRVGGLGERPIWFGGGHLGRDLSLPRLRADWPDTPRAAGDAVAEWTAARRNRRPVAPGRELTEPAPGLWREYAAELGDLRARLRTVPIGDQATWARVAKETSGAFAAWSQRVEAVPGPLAAAADTIAASAQVRAYQADSERRRPQAGFPSARGAAMLLASLAHNGNGPVAVAVLLQQLANTVKALHDMHLAAGEARRAADIERMVRTHLAAVSASLNQAHVGVPAGVAAAPAGAAAAAPGTGAAPPVIPDEQAAAAARVARRGQGPARAPGSPLPNPLRPARPAAAQPGRPAPGAGRGGARDDGQRRGESER